MFADVLTSSSESDSDLSINDSCENQQQDLLEETSEYRNSLLFYFFASF